MQDVSPAALFDGILAGGAVRRQLEAFFEVLALPGEVPIDLPREGDLVIRRALGEGGLVRMRTITAEDDGIVRVDLDASGRMPFDQLLVRPRTLHAEELESTSAVQARILWPALGFPAVVTPSGKPSSFTMRDGDATRCVCVLLLSNRKELSKEEAARHLRYVPWLERRGSPGSFQETELTVRNDVREPRLSTGRRDANGEHIAFGGNGSGAHGVVAYLPSYVRELYRKAGLAHLHEIRVSEEATARLQQGRYQLFWDDQDAELKLLIDRFARPRRAALGRTWQEHGDFLLKEYEFEYGGIHEPYKSQGAKETRAEILHPLFIQPRAAEPLRIGHVTDTHVDVRADVYEHNLKGRSGFNNFNTSFVQVYEDAKKDSDVLLLTGDLVDYGRGHWGLDRAGRVQDDASYQVDRNWFLFSYLLASGDAYTRPAYTILGNHDWRLNPYPPFAPGAPNPNELLHDHSRLSPEQQKQVIRQAHGDGHKRAFSYTVKAESTWQLVKERTGDAIATLVKLFGQPSNVEKAGFPTETSIESVAWYLLSINPFLDYAFTLPGRQSVLMLDWAKDEAVLFPRIVNGKEGPYDPLSPGDAAGTPRPSSSLTALQKRLVAEFVGGPSKAKVVGIHAPVISPYSDWYDADLLKGQKTYADKRKARGPNGGHPLFAVRPGGAPLGMVPERGSLGKERDWLVKTLGAAGASVRMVLTGHIHRNGLYVVYPARQEIYLATPNDLMRERRLIGTSLVRGVVEQAARGARPPAVTLTPEGRQGPLYVNTTSAGPRGSFEQRPLTERERAHGGVSTEPGYAHLELAADGTIRNVEFRTARGTAQEARRVAG